MAAASRRSVSTSDSHRDSHGSMCSFPPPRQELRLRELPPLKGILIHGGRVHQHSGILHHDELRHGRVLLGVCSLLLTLVTYGASMTVWG
ncbi:hypothetical protein QYE76_022468 [Lolium multiflorum]|uniref:Uncharacterized protein n=1 Tax=Lolium multiflorum TaxID=4521 RepID=A0AAD8R9V6_LOLMU|nr:hypothetical protein QYE76_022468 [Lolium multiflorum]